MSDPKKSARGKPGEDRVAAKQRTRGQQEADLLDSAKSTALGGIVEMLAGIQRGKQLREDAGERRARKRSGGGAGETPRAEIGSASTTGDMLFEFARLQVGILEQVLNFQRKHSDLLFQRLSGDARPSTGAHSVQPLILTPVVPTESQATGTFVVENVSTRKTHAAFRLSQLRSRDGAAPFTPKATFRVEGATTTATDIELEPDEEREVMLCVELDAHFKVGKRYRGHIVITMPGRPKIELPVRVDVKAAPRAASDES